MVTIKDVAAKAGVNPSTVSRVLKDSKSISQTTKDNVRKAMLDLGYVPNVAAQMLASGLTHNIGLIFPPLITPDRLNEPFFMQILSTITHEAKKKEFTVSIATGMTVDELKDQVKLMYRQKRVDGFIILYSISNDPVRNYLMENKVPFVIVGAPEGLENDITYVDNDNHLMGKRAVEYLYQKGHREILFVTDDFDSEVAQERYFGYLHGLRKLALHRHHARLFDHRNPIVLDELMEKIEEYDVTALIVVSDMISVKLTQWLSYYHLLVPDDISVITFNNSAYSTLVHPYFTTFDINISNLGRTSFRRLVEVINASHLTTPERTIVPFTLKERESVRQLPTKEK